jgi:predicted SnoaL-like aldol condensation-catalyzing enzyme
MPENTQIIVREPIAVLPRLERFECGQDSSRIEGVTMRFGLILFPYAMIGSTTQTAWSDIGSRAAERVPHMDIKRSILAAIAALLAITGAAAVQAQTVAAGRTSLAPPPAQIIAGRPVAVVGHPDPLSLLGNADPVLARNKRLVFDMWRGIVNAGHVELADTLLAAGYTQHSPLLPTGRDAFKTIFSTVPRQDEIPELVQPPLISIIAERDLVAMTLAEPVPEPDGSGTYTTTHFNMFRIENGRLAEHWHSLQGPPGPDVLPPDEGGPQPVIGVSGSDQYALLAADDPALAENKRLVFDMWRHIIDAGREEMADLYLSEDYIQHNPNAATGREGFKRYFSTRDDTPIEAWIRDPLVAMIAEGDLVVQAIKFEYPHPYRDGATYTTTWFDMFRIEDGLIAEHWDGASKSEATAAPD